MRRLCAVLTAAVLVSGCSDSSVGPDEYEEPETLRDTPENVITLFQMAYVDMDCEAYLDCLADDFTFHLAEVDLDGDTSLPEYWGRQTEETIHRRMFGDDQVQNPALEVERITLTLITGLYEHNEGADQHDPMDDRWTYRLNSDLRIWFPNNLQLRADADIEFVFRIDPDETGPEGETLYEIIRWEDLSGEWGRSEESSWGSIKAMYRGENIKQEG